jgi:hypothetical protein
VSGQSSGSTSQGGDRGSRDGGNLNCKTESSLRVDDFHAGLPKKTGSRLRYNLVSHYYVTRPHRAISSTTRHYLFRCHDALLRLIVVIL